VTFKVTTADSQGTLVVVELVHHTRGGPPRHRHHHQDEWFHVIEGDYVVAVGSDRFSLGPGDSAFGPRDIPHTWAFVGEAPGRIVLAVSPAGRFEAFLRALGQRQAMAPQDPAFWPPYDMELVGPPLAQALPAPVRPVPETFVTETSPPPPISDAAVDEDRHRGARFLDTILAAISRTLRITQMVMPE
jgi:quercetin dioxygenase-like cupin family protein